MADWDGLQVLQQRIFGELQLHIEFERIKVIACESCGHNPANLLVISRHSQFRRSAPDGKIVNYDLALVERALGDSTKFTEFGIPQMLHSQPDSRTQHSQNQPQRTSCRPQEE